MLTNMTTVPDRDEIPHRGDMQSISGVVPIEIIIFA